MSPRHLVVLGTASQVPTRYRNHNAYLLRFDDEGILFDPGEGAQRQLIHAGVRSTAITKICITHFHGDHCLGLAGVSQLLSLDGCPHAVDVFYPASGEEYYQRLRRASIYNDNATVRAHPIAAAGVLWSGPSQRGRTVLSSLPLDHGVPAWGYRFEEEAGWTLQPSRLAAAGLSGPAIGELQRQGRTRVGDREILLAEVAFPRPGQAVAFVMDTRMCDNAITLARGADLLVCEATYLEEDRDKAEAHGHLTAREAGIIAREAGVRRLVLTHFSRRYERGAPFLTQAEAEFTEGEIFAARDFDVIELPELHRELA